MSTCGCDDDLNALCAGTTDMAPSHPKEDLVWNKGTECPEKNESCGVRNRNTQNTGAKLSTEITKDAIEKRKQQTIIWHLAIGVVVVHIYFIFCLPHIPQQRWQTLLWNVFCFHVGGIGNTAGAHRLWSHHSYKATLPLRIILMLFYCVGGMLTYSIYQWARDHRVHHRYTDTDMDPYSAQRGFFFSHMGWLVVKRHPDCRKKIREVNVDDLLKDPVCCFERRYHSWLILVMCFIFPTVIPALCWKESWSVSFHVNFFRWTLGMHAISSINSLAHMFGLKPFNKNIFAAQNLFVSIVATGEGWHNFHHMFPWDYRASDFGFMNVSMHFIRFCKFLGLASDLKTASPELIKNVMLKYGDGSHPDWVPVGPEIPMEALHDPEFVFPDVSGSRYNELLPVKEVKNNISL